MITGRKSDAKSKTSSAAAAASSSRSTPVPSKQSSSTAKRGSVAVAAVADPEDDPMYAPPSHSMLTLTTHLFGFISLIPILNDMYDMI
jgi:hypothetical protein